MSCKFCYATFQDMKKVKQIAIADVFIILKKLKDAGVQKITFAGGEPLLYKDIGEAIQYSAALGLTVGIITNGSKLTDEFLKQHKKALDWVGISIDSIDPLVNEKIGRVHSNEITYNPLIDMIKRYGYKLKINTVVNRFNENEYMKPFIDWAQPLRWKVFDTLPVEGQNDKEFQNIKSSAGAFERYVKRNAHPVLVPENNEAMTGSYLLIDPQGRLFENSLGKHTYSSPLQNNTIEKCLSEIKLNRDMFIKRGGIYSW